MEQDALDLHSLVIVCVDSNKLRFVFDADQLKPDGNLVGVSSEDTLISTVFRFPHLDQIILKHVFVVLIEWLEKGL